jgi:archaellum component FlaC
MNLNNVLNSLYTATKIILVASISCFFIVGTYTLNVTLPKKIDAHVTFIENSANAHLNNLTYELEQFTSVVDKQTTILQSNLNTRTKEITTTLDNTSKDLNLRAKEITSTLGQVGNNVETVSTKIVSIPDDFKNQFKSQFDCENNGYCWPNLITDDLIASRKTLQDVSLASVTINNAVPQATLAFTKSFNLLSNDTLPALSTNLKIITGNVGEVTANIKKLTTPKWYDRILGYGVNGAIIYSHINPVSAVITTVMSQAK